MLTEVKYRTFDELLDSVRMDMHVQDAEGLIEPQQLIKVARQVNYDLGLKVNPHREKLIEVMRGKAKLPLDFYVLNFAVLCEGRKNWTMSPETELLVKQTAFLQKINELEDLIAEHRLPSFAKTFNLNAGQNIIVHNLQTTDVIVQLHKPNEPNLGFEYTALDANRVSINADVAITEVRVIIVGVGTDPGAQLSCIVGMQDTPTGIVISERTTTGVTTFHNPILMRIEESKAVSPECMNGHIPSPYRAAIKNGFLDTNLDEATIYINYQSLMEDDDGNLLVMDNDRVNEYYEYALKVRILENLFFAGENVGQMMQLAEARLRAARNNALSFVNTPDFNEMKRMWELNRRAQSSKYIDMFKSRL